MSTLRSKLRELLGVTDMNAALPVSAPPTVRWGDPALPTAGATSFASARWRVIEPAYGRPQVRVPRHVSRERLKLVLDRKRRYLDYVYGMSTDDYSDGFSTQARLERLGRSQQLFRLREALDRSIERQRFAPITYPTLIGRGPSSVPTRKKEAGS